MPPIIKKSGTKLTVKITATITNILSSVRPASQISPQKGTQNPPHIHVKVPKSMINKDTQ